MGYERTATRFTVNLSGTFAGEQLAGQGTITTLSMGGCSIDSTITLTIHSTVGLHIRIPDSPHPLEIEHAIVRWACGNLFGLEFERLSQSETDRLHHVLHNLEHGPLAAMPHPDAP